MEKRKAIYVDDLRQAIVEDKEIRGTAFAAIMKHLNAAPDVERWVSVDDELPALHIEKYEEPDGSHTQVDVSGFQWVITASGHQTKAMYETGVVFQGWVDEGGSTVRDVTHWMPLPEPPKGVRVK